MTRARRASRPRFRLLPTVLLTLAILGVPTVVYAWGRSSSSFDIVHVRVTGTRLVPDKRALRLLTRDYVGAQPLHGDGRRRAQDARAASPRLRRDRRPRLPGHPLRDHHRVRAGGLRPGRRALVRPRRERLRDLHRRGSGRPARAPRSRRPEVGAPAASARRSDAAARRRRRPTPRRRPGPTPRRPDRRRDPAATDAAATGSGGSRPSASSPARSRRPCRCRGSPSPAGCGRAPSSTTRRRPRCSA